MKKFSKLDIKKGIEWIKSKGHTWDNTLDNIIINAHSEGCKTVDEIYYEMNWLNRR